MSERGIVNTYDQLVKAGSGVAIMPAYSQGRETYFNGWMILRVVGGKSVKTNPGEGAWYEHGQKHFHARMFGGKSDRGKMALASAKMWVAEQGWYDGAWVRNAARDYVPVHINEQWPIRRHSVNP